MSKALFLSIDVRKFGNTEIFRTDLKQVFDFVRCSEDSEKLKELVNKDPTYASLDEATYDIMATFAHADILLQIKKNCMEGENVNMCKGLDMMIENGRKQGRNEGINLLILLLIKRHQRVKENFSNPFDN